MFAVAARRLLPAAALRAVAARSVVAVGARAPAAIRTFSAATPVANNAKIIENLRSELEFEEKENPSEVPEFVTNFSKSGWTIKDVEGEKEITVTRTHENEKITIICSTDSIVEHFATAEDEETALTIAATILIEKPEHPTAGSLEISAAIEEGNFFVEHVSFSKSTGLLHDQTAEGEWKRRGYFGGPSFTNLEESVQRDFHDFLAERGVNEDLAEFLQQYLEHKEQKEYKLWLKKVADFIAA